MTNGSELIFVNGTSNGDDILPEDGCKFGTDNGVGKTLGFIFG